MQAQLEIDTIEISSTQIPLKIQETGRSITVLDSKEILEIPSTSFEEIIQNVPGLEIQSRGGFGVQGDILMRGSTFTQVLVLIDGVKMNDPLTGHFNSYMAVSLGEIERIEIMRGPAAALYGADAVGGVINIITKTFSNQDHENAVMADFSYSEPAGIQSNGAIHFQKEKFKLGFGFQFNKSDGEFYSERILADSTTLSSYNSFFDIKTFSVSASYKLKDDLNLSFRSAIDGRDFSARYFYTNSTFDKSTETVGQWWNHLAVTKTTGNSSTGVNVAYKRNNDEFVFSPDFPSTNNHTSQYFNVLLHRLQYINDQCKLKGGIQIDQRSIESNDRGDHADFHVGSYIMGAFEFDRFNTSLSLRGDYDENYEFEFSPQLNLSYKFNKLVYRASAGKSIRAADYTERYVSNNLVDLTPGRSLGNPSLEAEKSWSVEAGADYFASKSVRLGVTVFSRDSENLIDFVQTNESEIGNISETGSLQSGADYFFAKNVTSVQTNGLEIFAELSHNFNQRNALSANLSYTLLNTTNEEDLISVYISSHARHLLSGNAIFDIGKWGLSVSMLHKNREGRIASSIDSALEDTYTVWNGKISIQINRNFRAYMQVQNMFDIQYQNILGAPMPGRWLFLGASCNFRN